MECKHGARHRRTRHVGGCRSTFLARKAAGQNPGQRKLLSSMMSCSLATAQTGMVLRMPYKAVRLTIDVHTRNPPQQYEPMIHYNIWVQGPSH
jgi:hypothetical protein